MGLSSPSQESNQLTSPLYLSFVTEITEVTGGIGGAGTRGGGEGGCPRAATKIQPSATTRTTHPIMGVGVQWVVAASDGRRVGKVCRQGANYLDRG